uniref:tetratricopeptide repeat protein n=1 Tax=Crocosphaera sp. Alani8 TaxID=3038952 RepID=UPI00313BBEAF
MSAFPFILVLLSLPLFTVPPANSQTLYIASEELSKEKDNHSSTHLKNTNQLFHPYYSAKEPGEQGTLPQTRQGTLDKNSEVMEDGTYFTIETFEGKAQEIITIELNSEQFDSYLILVSPDDKKIAENNDGGRGNNAKITVTLPMTGTYTIIVNTFEKETKGNYTLSLREGTKQELALAQAEELNQQAIQLYQEGKYQEAVPLAEQALEIRKNILGTEHIDISISLNNLALLYRAMGRYEQALPLYQDALAMDKKLLGDSHPSVATSLNNLAGLYRAMGRYEQALPLYQEALAMLKQLLGDSHPNVATSLNNLAGLYRAMGRYEQALPLYQDALAMRKKLLGDSHPSVATSLNNLAGLYRAMGRYEQAGVGTRIPESLTR